MRLLSRTVASSKWKLGNFSVSVLVMTLSNNLHKPLQRVTYPTSCKSVARKQLQQGFSSLRRVTPCNGSCNLLGNAIVQRLADKIAEAVHSLS